jgi:hypothetical protein
MTTIQLKRFALFRGLDYYPEGGWDDLHDTYSSLEEALEAVKKERFDDSYHWWHVVDLATQVKVKRSET